MILWCSKCGEDREASTVGPLVCSWCFGPLTPRDWPAFWQSLTAQETAEALRAAPKVAEPWVRARTYWSRKDMDGAYRDDGDVATVVDQPDGSVCWITCDSDGDLGRASDADEAKYAADAALVAAGWVLL